MNKLERIARKVFAFRQTIHVNENGVEIPVDIDEIIIVLSSNLVDFDEGIIASNKGNRKTNYSLQEVQECIKAGRYKFEDRQDGKANPENINMSEHEAVNVICLLTYADFVRKGDFNADIYRKFGYVRERTKTPIDLYVKFELKNGKGGKKVMVISFHEDCDYR